MTVGGNRVLCYSGTANCVAGTSATNSSGYYVENGYSAGTGYDLATGLGSVDVANLITYWSTVTFSATTTTLSVSPTSLVHGKTTTVSGTVARSSGSGTPTGSVSLTGNDGIPHYASIDDLALTMGSFYASVDNLPGGTYQLTAVYGGDGTYAASKSEPVTVTVAPENNTLATTGWAWNPYDLNLYPLSPGITLPYGAQIFLDAQPVSVNATIPTEPTPATGTVTFSDKLGTATVTATQTLNASGVAEWSTGVFAPGNHTVSESYSGDPSYNPSTAASAAAFTVIPGSTSLTIKPLVSSVAAGASVSVDVVLTTGYLSLYGTLPTGNVTVTLGTQSIATPWQPFGATGNASLEAVVTFSNVPAGMLPLNASYAGDSNWLGSAANGGTVISLAGKLTPTVVLTSSSASPAPGQSFTLTATVAGPSGKPTPTGTVAFLSDGQSFESLRNLTNGTATLAVPGYSAANGTNIFTAVYQGDANYNAATSNAVNITVAQSDFSLTTQNPELTIAPSGSGTSTLALAPVNGFSGTVTISAGGAPSGITVTPAATTLALSAPATDALTISVAASAASGLYPVTITASGGGHVHTAQVLIRVLTVAAPAFSPAAGTYSSPQKVTITDVYSGAVIYYTTNGTTPTTSSSVYTGPITVSATETLEAIATASGNAPSSVATAAYRFVVAAPAFSLAAGTYNTPQTLTISDVTPGAITYYTTNGTTPYTTSAVYSGPISITTSETIEAADTAPGYSSSPITTAAYTLVTAAPAFSLAAGTYNTTQTVILTDATPGAVIYYTTNGTTPTTSSTKYTAAVSLSTTQTLQAIAVASGFAPSSITAAAYKFVVAAPAFSLAAGTYNTPQTLTISDVTPGAITYYTTNGTTPYTTSAVYSGPISITTSETIEAADTAPGYSSSPITTAAYTLVTAAPAFSLAAGTYNTTQTVILTDATPGAVIYYTTNGTTPTTSSTKYTAAVSLSTTQTLQAIAVASGFAPSSITAAAYKFVVAAPAFSLTAGTYNTPQTLTISDVTPGATEFQSLVSSERLKSCSTSSPSSGLLAKSSSNLALASFLGRLSPSIIFAWRSASSPFPAATEASAVAFASS